MAEEYTLKYGSSWVIFHPDKFIGASCDMEVIKIINNLTIILFILKLIIQASNYEVIRSYMKTNNVMIMYSYQLSQHLKGGPCPILLIFDTVMLTSFDERQTDEGISTLK